MLVYSINVFVVQSSISFLYYELHVRNNFELQTHAMCNYYYYLTAEQCHMIFTLDFLMPSDNYQRLGIIFFRYKMDDKVDDSI